MPATLQGIEARVRSLAQETVSRAGYELVDVDYRREPGGWILRLFIDKDGGVSLADCERISHEFGTVLEVEDPIPHQFNLEVSSPGLDRPLKKDSDFLAAQGKLIRVVTLQPIAGQRHFSGRVTWAGPGEGGPVVRLRDDAGVEHDVAVGAIEKARLVYEWPAGTAKAPMKPGRRIGRTGKK